MNVIEFSNVGKKFRLFHEKEQTLKGYFLRKVRKESSKRVEEFWALKDLTFAVQQGEILGIIGENGSGKSTLLKLIGGILRPTEGKLEIEGNITGLLELGSGFHPDLTGRENIYLNASIIGLKKKEIDEKFEEIVRFAELEKFIDTPVKNYSSGMYVRLGFAVAININPDIVLVDEVLAVGDEAFQKKCMEKFNQFRKENKTIIIVSHGLDTIKDLCTRAIWLDAGKVKAEGPPAMVVNQYLEEVAEREEREFKYRSDQIRKQTKKRWGSGEVEIRDLTFHDKSLEEKAQGAGHGGMDFIEDFRLIQCLREGKPTDSDVYDGVTISAVVALSEKSIAARSSPVKFPDFTRGKWKSRKPLGIVTA